MPRHYCAGDFEALVDYGYAHEKVKYGPGSYDYIKLRKPTWKDRIVHLARM